MNFVLILYIAGIWADCEKKTQNLSGRFRMDVRPRLNQELGRRSHNILCSFGCFPCGLGFLCSWWNVLLYLSTRCWYSHWRTVGQLSGCAGRSHCFSKTKTWSSPDFLYVWIENSEQVWYQIANAVLTLEWQFLLYVEMCWWEITWAKSLVRSGEHPDWLSWHFLSFTVLANAK